MYEATLQIYGKTFKGEGESIFAALQSVNPGIAKGKSVLTLKQGEKEMVRVLSGMQTAKLFHPNPKIKEIGVKQIAARFDV